MKIKAVCVSHVGLRRTNNEDNYYFNGRFMSKDNNGTGGVVTARVNGGANGLFAVFDGMGGHQAGELASYTAASYVAQNHGNLPQNLSGMLVSASEEVFRCGMQSGNSDMGTTAVVLYFEGDNVHACNLGDSPAYRLRGGSLQKLTVDHVEELPAGSRHKPRLTQCLGIDPTELLLQPSLAKDTVKAGDMYLLCSDGLTDMVAEADICAIMQKGLSLQKVAENLLQAALNGGGIDNTTIIVCKAE